MEQTDTTPPPGQVNEEILQRLTTGLPLTARPYEAIGDELGVGEDEVLARVRALRDTHRLRPISGTFDGSVLGYQATLGVVAVAEERIDVVTAALQSLPCIPQIFEIEDHYRLWFVAAAPTAAHVEAIESEVRARTGEGDISRVLPTELYAVTASFDADGAPDPHGPRMRAHPATALSRDDRALVRLLQGDFPPTPRPFAEIAGTLVQCGFDLDERRVLERAQALAAEGVLVRVAATARERRGAWRLAVVVWRSGADVGEAVGRLASFPETLHCFLRRVAGCRTAIVSIIEAPDRVSMDRSVERIRSAAGLEVLRLQYPVREFTRVPTRYFTEGEW